MRKIFFIVVILLGSGLVYYFYDPGVIRYLPDFLRSNLPIVTETTAYKWRDPQGNWQLSQQPPAAGLPYETITIPHDTNVLPSEAITGSK